MLVVGFSFDEDCVLELFNTSILEVESEDIRSDL